MFTPYHLIQGHPMKIQISRETKPGSGTFEPVEVFDGDSLGAITRMQQLQVKAPGAYLAEPVQTPSAEPASSH